MGLLKEENCLLKEEISLLKQLLQEAMPALSKLTDSGHETPSDSLCENDSMILPEAPLKVKRISTVEEERTEDIDDEAGRLESTMMHEDVNEVSDQ